MDAARLRERTARLGGFDEEAEAERYIIEMDPTKHCFREDNCNAHQNHSGPDCCCCGQLPEKHTGCDCEDD